MRWPASWSLTRLNPASVTYCVNGARENARQVREEISSEQWQRLNRLYHQMHSPHAQAQFRSSINDVLATVVDGIHLFKGVSDTTMIHGQGWQFIRLGRYLERAYATATLLEVYQPWLFTYCPNANTPAINISSWWACCAAARPSRRIARCTRPILPPDRILEFLLLNRDFPHAIRYSVDGIRHAIESIQRTGGRRPPEELTAGIGQAARHAWLYHDQRNSCPEIRRHFCTPSASSACASTNSSTAITCSIPSSPRWLT